MKKFGIVLICLEVIALISSAITGNISDMFASGGYGIVESIGFFLPGIIGIVLVIKGKKKEEAQNKE